MRIDGKKSEQDQRDTRQMKRPKKKVIEQKRLN